MSRIKKRLNPDSISISKALTSTTIAHEKALNVSGGSRDGGRLPRTFSPLNIFYFSDGRR